jgi:hypothetical protein
MHSVMTEKAWHFEMIPDLLVNSFGRGKAGLIMVERTWGETSLNPFCYTPRQENYDQPR